jgi:cation-transporting P-type ATPase I
LPGSVAAAAVLVDNQPRLRRLLEARLGTPAADLVLAVANATSLALT